MQVQFVRASFLPYLASLGPERTRQHIVAGKFGPRFQPRGRQRETLLRLETVIGVLGLDQHAIPPAVARYLAEHKLERPPIVTADINSLRRVLP